MKAIPRYMFLLLIFLTLFPVVSAQETGHLRLLAVAEGGAVYTGKTADLYLTLSPGTGRVFIETYPLTKLDTQISTRFAQEVACSLLEDDCDEYDFFYTIEADSSIVGGPSAGAAIAGLTASMIAGYEVDESVTITGTINSGGLIGPVAGIKEKIGAAAASGDLQTVLIPQGKRYLTEDNETLDMVTYGDELGVTVKEVAHLEEVVYEFTGEQVGREIGELMIDDDYARIMQGLADQLCSETPDLEKQIDVDVVRSYNETDVLRSMQNLTASGEEAMLGGDSYSAASFCFGANVKGKYLALLSSRPRVSDVRSIILQTQHRVSASTEDLESRKLETITDLQTKLIVQERIQEAESYLVEARRGLSGIDGESYEDEMLDVLYSLAFSIERLNSADSWSSFFDSGGVVFDLDEQMMRRSCVEKINEAQERLQYLSMIVPGAASLVREDYDEAGVARQTGDYGRCLFIASKSKARANLVLTIYGQDEENLDDLIGNKIEAVERVVYTAIDKGVFPLLGYSYLEYGKTLRADDPSSALLYLEFAQELSNFNQYFPEKESVWSLRPITKFEVLAFIIGLLLGLLVSNAPWCRRKRKSRKKGAKSRARSKRR